MIKKKSKVPNWTKPGFVYFISAGDAIKIGFASVVTARLSALQISTHNNLTLLAQIPGTRLTEKEYHDRFEEYLIRGEWFRSDAEPILQEINRINGVVPEPPPLFVNPYSKEIGILIEQRKPYAGQFKFFERFNIIVGGLREWPHASTEVRAGIARNINRARKELHELGVVVG